MKLRSALIERHSELIDYHNSLIKTHERVARAGMKSSCAYRRAVKIGRKLAQRSRAIKAEATSIFNQVKKLDGR